MTDRAALEELRAAGRHLIRAMDDMHARGETFTARVSLATCELRRMLQPTWPRDGHGECVPTSKEEK